MTPAASISAKAALAADNFSSDSGRTLHWMGAVRRYPRCGRPLRLEADGRRAAGQPRQGTRLPGDHFSRQGGIKGTGGGRGLGRSSIIILRFVF